MPLQKEEDFGTNADGSKSEEYCFHCFQNGKFLDEGITPRKNKQECEICGSNGNVRV
jgi:hypothetical protein